MRFLNYGKTALLLAFLTAPMVFAGVRIGGTERIRRLPAMA